MLFNMGINVCVLTEDSPLKQYHSTAIYSINVVKPHLKFWKGTLIAVKILSIMWHLFIHCKFIL